jgi:hypothetical protein
MRPEVQSNQTIKQSSNSCWRRVIFFTLVLAFCVIGAPKAASANGCNTLSGIAGTCKASAGGTDADTNASTVWVDRGIVNVGGCTGGQVCTMTRGSELCAAVAKKIGIAGTFLCVSSDSDCKTNISSAFSASSQLCPPSQQCCISNATTAPTAVGGTAGSGAKTPATPKQLPDPLGGVNIPTFIGNVIRTFAGIAGTIALIMFVYGGIMLILSGGEAKKVADGKNILINASIGLVLIFSAYTFVSAIISAILAE